MKNAERWIERGKTLLIVLLTLSACWLLAALTWGEHGFAAGPSRQPAPGGGGGVTLTAATMPASLVITGPEGRYGVQYDQGRVDEFFARLSPLVGDGLASAGTPVPLREEEWRRCLSDTGAYFDFAGEIPLSALCGWFSADGVCPLEGSARRLLLCAGEGDQVLLCWQDAEDGGFYSCPTDLTQSLHLDPVLGDYRPNGAYFAYEDETLAGLVQPYTLVTEEIRDGTVYAAADPLNSDTTAALLSALSFSDQNYTRTSGGAAYVDGGDRLEIEDGGDVVYRASRGDKYPAGAGAGEAIEAARTLVAGTAGALCGDAELYLISAGQTEDGFEVRFGYRLDGSAVRLHGEGWCARFRIRDGYITEFVLRLRSYTATGETALLLPIEQAAAMLPELTPERPELAILYLDGGAAQVSPQWVAG